MDIVVYAFEENDHISVVFEYNTNLFKEETMEKFTKDYKYIIKDILEHSDAKIEDLEILKLRKNIIEDKEILDSE
ncbi:MAG TPA: hypothetical protein DCM59_11835, partial [Clostridium sp.]|nr:hypothetical protein [Clostridium sp.]